MQEKSFFDLSINVISFNMNVNTAWVLLSFSFKLKLSRVDDKRNFLYGFKFVGKLIWNKTGRVIIIKNQHLI